MSMTFGVVSFVHIIPTFLMLFNKINTSPVFHSFKVKHFYHINVPTIVDVCFLIGSCFSYFKLQFIAFIFVVPISIWGQFIRLSVVTKFS